MGLRALGDSAWIFKSGATTPEAHLDLILRLMEVLESHRIPEITDLVSSYETLAVHFRPGDGERVFKHLTSLPPPDDFSSSPQEDRTFTIPVAYDPSPGSDLAALASAKQMSTEQVIRLHHDAEYRVAAIGFSPGFPYLLGLPELLQAARHPTPKPVAAGAVAIAGSQAGIYPSASPGGWHVLGRTDVTLFDPHRSQTAWLKPGDRVRFVPTSIPAVGPTSDTASRFIADGAIEIIDPGAFTSVQDLGRPGWQHAGVSPGGAADPVAAHVANRLVGNPDNAAVLECTMTGPKIRFHQAARIAWVGWADTRSGRTIEVRAGDTIDLRGRLALLRGYIAITGGIAVPPVLGSRATDIRAGFGGHCGRTLQSGDRLPIGEPTQDPVQITHRIAWPHPNPPILELRFIRGMQSKWFTEASMSALTTQIYQTSAASDRMGVRLDGPALELHEPREMVSQPVVAGSIQVPPNGKPIVLMAERQTIGGYPQIGHVISADLPRLARAWPGAGLRFREVTLDEAREAWNDAQRELGLLHAGLMTLT